MAEAERSAETALRLAEEIDDANLMSAALDAMAGIAIVCEKWLRVRDLARRRVGFQDRLSMYEWIDAYSLVVWSSCLSGELEEADRVSAHALGLVRPGQAPAPVLHLLAWRLFALALLGQWDKVLRLAPRASSVWVDTGRLAAGYALRGFLAAIDVARARRERPAWTP